MVFQNCLLNCILYVSLFCSILWSVCFLPHMENVVCALFVIISVHNIIVYRINYVHV